MVKNKKSDEERITFWVDAKLKNKMKRKITRLNEESMGGRKEKMTTVLRDLIARWVKGEIS